MQIDYTNPTDNEIRRIVSEALVPADQIKILHDFTGRPIQELREICGMAPKTKAKHYKRGRPGFWNDEKVQYLYEHPNEKCQDLAKRFGVSCAAVASVRHQLGIKQVSIWTDDLVAKLTLAYRNGLRAKKIAELLDMDLYEVQKKIIAMKQTKKL